MFIKQTDLKASYLSHKDEIDREIIEVMESGWYILGEKVASFETNFAKYICTKECVGFGSGTDALQFALRACGIGRGNVIITVSNTAVATVSSIDWVGAKPLLVDIEVETYTIDPNQVEDVLKNDKINAIKAIIPVHLYGHPADMKSLSELANKYQIALIEDCAQAHGALIGGQKVGTLGVCGAFSFYPTKNMGAFGDAGAVVTSDDDVNERLRLLQQYGWKDRYVSHIAGYNSRLDELQAAILNCKLDWVDSDNDRRCDIAKMYHDGLSDLPVILPIEKTTYKHVYHQYVIRCDDRDRLREYLKSQGISTAVLYPVPIHLQAGYRNIVNCFTGGLAVTEKLSTQILCLPIYPELSDEKVSMVINVIKRFYN